ncbi:MFS transporter [Propionivibrio limicola]|uniref:MFS transporter n=1 Tax=Propionivibrio limicola TaxID=167645 RepID=UPI0014783094|nr:MFS transporter [Propionivibrio limicola]
MSNVAVAAVAPIGKDWQANTLDVHKFLSHRHVGATQWQVGILAFIVLILDGFDVVSFGFIIPALLESWQVSREAMGPVLVSGLVGLAIGAFSGGPLADIFGRRKVIIGSVLLFGIMSLISAFSPNLTVLVILRFLTGLGLGASQPNTGTLVSEYAPARHRSIFVTLTYCGFTVGAAAGGFLSAALLANYGWESILIVGGIVPMLFAGICYFLLPESPSYLALHPARRARLAAILNKIEPGVADKDTQFISAEATHHQSGKAPFLQILSKTHLPVTLMLWLGTLQYDADRLSDE